MENNKIEIPLVDVMVGSKLATDIYDGDGLRLLAAGNVLTEELLDELNNIGITTVCIVEECL